VKLTDLDARFLRWDDARSWQTVDILAEASGVIFQCPKCAEGKERGEEDGRRFVRGAHSVICWFVGKVPDDADPKPGRWTPSGTGLDDLTFVPGDPPRAISVLLTGPGCGWHGFVRQGEATLT
jgi:hypothetical protein